MKAFGQRYSATISEDATIWEVVPVLRGLLCAVGYHPESVDSIFVDEPENDECNECVCGNECDIEPEELNLETYTEDTTLQITPVEKETHTVTLIYDI